MSLKKWVRRDLRHGDLTALIQIARGATTVDEERSKRLSQRGFINVDAVKRLKLTNKGRIAVIIKKMSHY